jgi:tetratricopeptide (TPR) repeat protein
LSRVLRRTTDIKGAVDAASKATKADPGCAEGHFTLGLALMESNDPENAARAFETAIQKGPDWAEAHTNRGNAFSKLGRWGEAKAAYRQARKIKPDLWKAHYKLGAVLYRTGNLKDAIESFRRVIDLKEQYPWGSYCHHMLGTCQWKLDHRKEAEAHWKKAVVLIEKAKEPSPQDGVQSYRRLAIVCIYRGETERARGYLDRLLARKHEDVSAWVTLGIVLGELGLHEKSLETFQKGHQLGIRQGVKWRVPSARLVERAKRRVELAKKLERVLQEGEPGSAEDMTILAKICHAKQRYACAARFYEEAFTLDPGLKIPVRGWSENLLRAGCSAVQAASGRGKEKGTLAPEERKRFRDLALVWLEEELDYLMAAFDQGEEEDHARNLLWMIHVHRDLEPVRDSAALARLPDTERLAWQAFWKKVNTTLESLHE